jgi:hypothetical protein
MVDFKLQNAEDIARAHTLLSGALFTPQDVSYQQGRFQLTLWRELALPSESKRHLGIVQTSKPKHQRCALLFGDISKCALLTTAKLDRYTVRRLTRTREGLDIEAECGTKLTLELTRVEGRLHDLPEVTDEAFGKINIRLGFQSRVDFEE